MVISISKDTELLKMSTSLLFETIVTTSDASQSVSNCHDFNTDIGNYLQGSNPSDFIEVGLLEMNNIPSNDFVYPFSVHLKKGKDEVNSPLTKFAKIMGANGDFSVHSNHLYHKHVVQVELFLNTYKNPQTEIVNVLNSNRMKTVNDSDPLLSPYYFLGVKI